MRNYTFSATLPPRIVFLFEKRKKETRKTGYSKKKKYICTTNDDAGNLFIASYLSNLFFTFLIPVFPIYGSTVLYGEAEIFKIQYYYIYAHEK